MASCSVWQVSTFPTGRTSSTDNWLMPLMQRLHDNRLLSIIHQNVGLSGHQWAARSTHALSNYNFCALRHVLPATNDVLECNENYKLIQSSKFAPQKILQRFVCSVIANFLIKFTSWRFQKSADMQRRYGPVAYFTTQSVWYSTVWLVKYFPPGLTVISENVLNNKINRLNVNTLIF